jgi:hypothetical protein
MQGTQAEEEKPKFASRKSVGDKHAPKLEFQHSRAVWLVIQ